MVRNRRNIGPLLIILAGCFWGSMGIFVRKLTSFGFSSVQIVSIRVTLAALFFCILLLIKDRSGFRISLRDIPLFLGLGFGSILFFTVCYFTAITMMPLSTAAILLYTSPIWIMLMSVLFFHEKLNGRKLLALGLAFTGCVLVSGISGDGITLTGLLIGLGAGFGYGLYSILGTVALRKYSPYTVTTYTFLFAAVGSWLICEPADMISKFAAAPSPISLLLFCDSSQLFYRQPSGFSLRSPGCRERQNRYRNHRSHPADLLMYRPARHCRRRQTAPDGTVP